MPAKKKKSNGESLNNHMKIVFFGTPEFSATILNGLVKHNLKPLLVITSPDKPVGRNQILTSPAVKVAAEKHSLTVLQPQDLTLPDLQRVLQNTEPDLIVVSAYGPPFLGPELLKLPRFGCLNLHPSLLPKYRGASPIPWAILNGEKETGVTIIRLSEKIDQGDILAQAKTEIEAQDTTLSLTKKLADLGAELLVKTVNLLPSGQVLAQSQGISPTPYCFQLKKEQGLIDWLKPALQIERQVRAFDPWPGAFTRWEKKNLKILKARVSNEMKPNEKPGFVFLSKDRSLTVQTTQGSLAVEMLQLEGKKPLSSGDFLRGQQEIIGQTLC